MLDHFVPTSEQVSFQQRYYVNQSLYTTGGPAFCMFLLPFLLSFIFFFFDVLYFILFYFILFYFILFYFILFYFILFYFNQLLCALVIIGGESALYNTSVTRGSVVEMAAKHRMSTPMLLSSLVSSSPILCLSIVQMQCCLHLSTDSTA